MARSDDIIECANCGDRIGRLETPRVFNDQVVCAKCWEKLSDAEAAELTAALEDAPPPPADKVLRYGSRERLVSMAPPMTTLPVQPLYSGRACPVCGSTAKPVRKAKGSSAMLIILLLLWVLPGILYLIFYSGYIMVCPDCGAKIADAT
jgi:ssDNA-binding Zn-finger/Zn-ribbon topoisomerase 1